MLWQWVVTWSHLIPNITHITMRPVSCAWVASAHCVLYNTATYKTNCTTGLYGQISYHITEVCMYIRSYISACRQFKFRITAWPKLGNKATENANKPIKYIDSYYNTVEPYFSPPTVAACVRTSDHPAPILHVLCVWLHGHFHII